MSQEGRLFARLAIFVANLGACGHQPGMESLSVATATDPTPTTLRRHRIVLAVLGVVAIGLSALVWFHPTLGYAQGGVIDGADLRRSLLVILWAMFGVFALSSTLVLTVLRGHFHAAVRYLAAYAVGIAAAIATLPVLDHYL
jgi:hypothetical protein